MSDMISLSKLLHPQLRDKCMLLFSQEHFIEAARDAVVLVEDELRRKAGCTSHYYGVKLVDHVFGKEDPVRLRTVLDAERHRAAEQFFKGTFAYYRNYVMHHASGIHRDKCATVLVVASELLWLVGAGVSVFKGEETLNQLICTGQIDSARQLGMLLQYLDGRILPDEVYDGMFEMLADNHVPTEVFELVHDLGLVEWTRRDVVEPADQALGGYPTELIDIAELTDDGREMLRLCAERQPFQKLDAFRSAGLNFAFGRSGRRDVGSTS
ncbi:MAG: TIGR02391 family protein [Armatimonadia bacterium]